MCEFMDEKLQSQLETLSEDYDCFGLPPLKIEGAPMKMILVQLIDNAFLFIKHHRAILSTISDCNLEKTRLLNEAKTSSVIIERTKQEIKEKERLIANLQLEIRKQKDELKEVKKYTGKLKEESAFMQRVYNSKKEKLEIAVKKLTEDYNDVERKLNKSIGTHQSSDSIFANELRKYKLREEVYEDTIQQLHNNNEQLLEEILNLKHEILQFMFERSERNGEVDSD